MKNLQKTICYYPELSKTNDYSKNLVHILSKLYQVECFDTRLPFYSELNRIRGKNCSTLILNWPENEILIKGNFSIQRSVKMYFKMIIFYVSFKNIIYVNHNLFPHDTKDKTSKILTKAFIKFTRAISKSVVVHADIFKNKKKFHYVPHPLYLCNGRSDSAQTKGYHLVFGRIKRYKQIEKVIESFPEGQSLVIAGHPEDTQYLLELENLIKDKPNIKITGKSLSKKELNDLIINCTFVLLPGKSESVILSGSIIHALSCNKPVLCLKTETNQWLSKYLPKGTVTTFPSIFDLCKSISTLSSRECLEPKIKEHFSEEKILNKMKDLISPKKV